MGQQRRTRGASAARAVAAVAAIGLFVWPLPVHASQVRVRVNGTAVAVTGPDATVADALSAAGIQLRAGIMRSLVTGTPIDGPTRPAKLWRDDTPVEPDAHVHTGSRIRVANGQDYVEPTTDEITLVPEPGFPAVETEVWLKGRPGQIRRSVGRYSGETVEGQVVSAPVPPSVAAPLVLFSFDDGPDPQWTPQVLAILKEKGVRAVFCLVGQQIQRYPALVKAIADAGHALCDHTQDHDMYMSGKDPVYVAAQMDNPYNQIRDITGHPPEFYRGPGGDLSPFIIDRAHELGMRVLGWSVDPADYRKPGAEAIQDRIALNIRGGGVALMHDGGGDRSQTVAQLPGLIERLRAAGYTISVP